MPEFQVGESVQVGGQGEKGKIIEITRPLGTYPIYKVHMMGTGQIKNAAKHELVKGMPDEIFHNLFDCFDQPQGTATSTISLADLINDNILSTVNASDIDQELFERNKPAVNSIPITANGNRRFVELPISPADFILNKENKRTKSKTISNIKLLTQFLETKNETRMPENIPPSELNAYLMEFLLSVRQVNGSEYEPSTLRNMISSFDRYLKDHGYQTTITKGDQFSQTMKVFSSKAKDLKMKGKGNKPNAAEPATDAEIETLYSCGQLGSHNPGALINTLWLNNTLHLGMRGGGSEHRQLMWGDIALHNDTVLNTEYMEYNERQTKTRTGEDLNNIRTKKPRIYATGTDTCPIAVYKTYASHRPEQFSGPETPFYLGAVTNTKNPRPNEQWFLQQAVGVNKLSSLMSTMAKKAGLPEVSEGKRITNTSIRKRLCQKLLSANVPDTQAIHITGHKNSDSLNHYRTLTNHQQRNISNILANTSSTSLPVSRPPQQLTGNNYSAMPMSTTEQGHITNSLTGNNYSAMPMSTTEQGHITNSLTGNNYSAMPMSTTEQGHITNSLTGNNYSAMPMSTTEQGHITNSLTGNNYSAMPMSTTEQGYIANSTSLAHTRKSSHVLQCSETGLPSGLFQNATINGGTFNITIMSGKRKLETTTNSDEDCLRASQEF